MVKEGRSQWPRDLRRRSAAARLLRLWVRIPPGAWMFVCCECCVLSSRGLCDELITRPEESYRLWCVVVCDLETSWMRRPWPTGGLSRQKQTNKQTKNKWWKRSLLSPPSEWLGLACCSHQLSYSLYFYNLLLSERWKLWTCLFCSVKKIVTYFMALFQHFFYELSNSSKRISEKS